MTTLLERFIPEAREYLESAAQGLLKLERTPSSESLINEVFRAVHTLKGTSGLFDMPGLTRVVHAGEDLLGAVRSHRLALDPDMVDALLDGLDKVSAWVDELERHGRLPDDAEGVSVELSGRVRSLLVVEDEAARPHACRDGRVRPTGWANCRRPIVSRRSPKPSPAAPRCWRSPMRRMTVASIAAKIRSTCCSSLPA